MIRLEAVERYSDVRGALIKAWPATVTGEVYAVELRPEHPRGHHWHRHGGEWFMALQGSAWLVVEDPKTGDRRVVRLETHRAYVPAGIAHALYCDAPALILAVADVHHDDEDTVRHAVQAPSAAERSAPC